MKSSAIEWASIGVSTSVRGGARDGADRVVSGAPDLGRPEVDELRGGQCDYAGAGDGDQRPARGHDPVQGQQTGADAGRGSCHEAPDAGQAAPGHRQ
jgi:hypothetical protein